MSSINEAWTVKSCSSDKTNAISIFNDILDGYILAAGIHLFDMEDQDSQPKKNTFLMKIFLLRINSTKRSLFMIFRVGVNSGIELELSSIPDSIPGIGLGIGIEKKRNWN